MSVKEEIHDDLFRKNNSPLYNAPGIMRHSIIILEPIVVCLCWGNLLHAWLGIDNRLLALTTQRHHMPRLNP